MYPNKPIKPLALSKPFVTPSRAISISTPTEGGSNSNQREYKDSNSTSYQDSNNNNNNHQRNHNKSGNSYNNQNSHSSNQNNHNNNNYSHNDRSNSSSNNDYNSKPSGSNYNQSRPQNQKPQIRLPQLDNDDDFDIGLDKDSREERALKTNGSSSSKTGGARDAAAARVRGETGYQLKAAGKATSGQVVNESPQDEIDRKEVQRRKEIVDKMKDLKEHAKSKKGQSVVAKLNTRTESVQSLYKVPSPNLQKVQQQSEERENLKFGRLQDRRRDNEKGKKKLRQKQKESSQDSIEDISSSPISIPVRTIKKKKNPFASTSTSRPKLPSPSPSPPPPPPRSPSPPPVNLQDLIDIERKKTRRKEKRKRKLESSTRRAARVQRAKDLDLDAELASDNSESEVDSDSDLEEVYIFDRSEREESHDELLISDDEAPDPSTLCPFCSRSLPPNPSKRLQKLKSYLLERDYIRPRPTTRNPLGMHLPVIETASFCRRHVEECTTIPDGIKRGWPEKIDWKGLEKRIDREVFKHLSQIITGKIQSSFFEEAKKDWEKESSKNKMNNILSEFGNFDAEQPGYYGTQGQEIMITALRRLFIDQSPLLTILNCAPLDISTYLRRVLVPECAVELIRLDLGGEEEGITRTEAEKVCIESRGYGKAMFGASEEEEKFGKDEDKRESREKKEREEKEREREIEKREKSKKIKASRKRKEEEKEEEENRKKVMEDELHLTTSIINTSSSSGGLTKRVPKQKLAAMELAATKAAAVQKLSSISSTTSKHLTSNTTSNLSKPNKIKILKSSPPPTTSSSMPTSPPTFIPPTSTKLLKEENNKKKDLWKKRIAGDQTEEEENGDSSSNSSEDEVVLHPRKKLKRMSEISKEKERKKKLSIDSIKIDDSEDEDEDEDDIITID